MTYCETCDYLFTKTPQFEKTGASAYKPGLATSNALDAHLGHPHRRYHTIHVTGTNGKGSTCHTLAAVLQKAGYKVGLFTSPHLVDFRERIKVNGTMCSEQFVVDFVEQHRTFFEPLRPSFFELTTAMAFQYFAEQQVDVAVVEVGLGGRLDSTNIILPDLCVITNISLDHTDLLGGTLAAVAAEKAGIMKAGVPCVVGETLPETMPVFQKKAAEVGCPLILAEQYAGEVPQGELLGDCQKANMRTILTAVEQLQAMPYYDIPSTAVSDAIVSVCELTGLRGRWEKLADAPLTLCDVGHNPGAWLYLGPRLTAMAAERRMHIVFGMVADKDVDNVLTQLPPSAAYYWAQADTHRALPVEQLKAKAERVGLKGEAYLSVPEAYAAACCHARPVDGIFIGGSCYIVADLLSSLQKTH